MSKLWIPLFASLTLLSSCSNGPDNSESNTEAQETSAPVKATSESAGQAEAPKETSIPAEAAGAKVMAAEVAAAFREGTLVGIVMETMDSGGYTYVKLDTPNGEVWAAGPPTKVQVGQAAGLGDSFLMDNFEASSLSRTFEKIYFCSSIQTAETIKGGAASAEPKKAATASKGAIVTPAENGQTIGEVLTNSADYVGKEVTIRARVVKYSAAIMKKNWMHLQDGTGEPGKHDLTITTLATAAVGDIVLIKGTLIADKDFGFGYKYELIVEDAEVTIQ